MSQPLSRARIVARTSTALAAVLAGSIVAAQLLAGAAPAARADDVRAKARAAAAYAHLPLAFEANRGQADPRIDYLARGSGYTVFLSGRRLVLGLHRQGRSAEAVDAVLVGGNRRPSVAAAGRLRQQVNYLTGRDPARWITHVPAYARVTYRDVYPRIDLAFYGSGGRLEQDFVVRPGGDPARIALSFSGARSLRLDRGNDLVLRLEHGSVRLQRPTVYQLAGGRRQPVDASYVLAARGRVRFRLGSYDRARPVVIDPTFFYSTYLGGSDDDSARSIAVDSAGNAYVVGATASANFPTTPLARQSSYAENLDAFVSELNPTGSGLVYSTYLGGSSGDVANAIALDGSGRAFVTGFTSSQDFPVTPLAFQGTGGSSTGRTDAFVTELDPSGSALLYSTYLGGSDGDVGTGIAVDGAGNAYVAGGTSSNDFPTTPLAFQPTAPGDENAFAAKLNAAGSALVYSTYLGGSAIDAANDVAVDASGAAFVVGSTRSVDFPTTPLAFQTSLGGPSDAFVTKLDATGSTAAYSTLVGGSSFDDGQGLAIDAAGYAYAVGDTSSVDFPTTPGAYTTGTAGSVDAFATKLNPTGSAPAYSSRFGGANSDVALAVAVDGTGRAYLTGNTASTDFPTANAVQGTYGGGFSDAFVTQLNEGGSGVVYSTFLGGSASDEGDGIALDALPNPDAYVAGPTISADFPTTPGAFQTSFAGGNFDAFVAKIANIANIVPPPTSVGRVTGGGSIGVTGGIGTFGFVVQRDTATGPVSGDLQYVNHATGANVHSVAFTSFVIADDTATFAGTCTNSGAACTFTVDVTDNGEPGSSDAFAISVSGGPTEGGVLRRGNIQIRQ